MKSLKAVRFGISICRAEISWGATELLQSALNACKRFDPLDFISIEVQAAWETLGEITGETATEAIIEEIFAKFCVGK